MLVGAELVGSALDLSITMANTTSVNSSVLQVHPELGHWEVGGPHVMVMVMVEVAGLHSHF